MSQLSSGISRTVSTGILGTLAFALTFGVVQFAAGRDLNTAGSSLSDSHAGINRESKSDRAARPVGSVLPMNTISFRLNGLPDTSVLLRLPASRDAVDGAAASPLKANTSSRPTLACEPVVSVLTEVAKRLQPGRCVT